MGCTGVAVGLVIGLVIAFVLVVVVVVVVVGMGHSSELMIHKGNVGFSDDEAIVEVVVVVVVVVLSISVKQVMYIIHTYMYVWCVGSLRTAYTPGISASVS